MSSAVRSAASDRNSANISKKLDFWWSIPQKETIIGYFGARNDPTITIIEAMEVLRSGKSLLRTLRVIQVLEFSFLLMFWKKKWLVRFMKYHIERSIFQTFWKLHCCAKSLFFELETSNCGYLFIFWIPLTVQSFSKFGQHSCKTFCKGPPFEFLVDFKTKKLQRGDPYKMFNINVVQSCWNFSQLKKIKK